MASDDDRQYFDYLEKEILGWIETYILNSGQLPASDYDVDTTVFPAQKLNKRVKMDVCSHTSVPISIIPERSICCEWSDVGKVAETTRLSAKKLSTARFNSCKHVASSATRLSVYRARIRRCLIC